MKNQRETALDTFKAQSIKQDPISWHLWKRAFDEGVRYQKQLVKNNSVLDEVSQQRELLLDFLDNIGRNDYEIKPFKQIVDDYLKSNNCG